MPSRHRWILGIVAAATTLTVLVGTGATSMATSAAEPVPSTDATAASTPGPENALVPVANLPAPVPTAPAETIENVVFILADDLDWATFRQVPRLAALPQQGLTMLNTVSTDSLCCPSRVSILRGQYVHNHLVVSNRVASGGGWDTFNKRGEEADCLPVWLDNAGVTTAFFGKYVNEYGTSRPRFVPPGWDRWFVPVTQAAMYKGYNYTVNDDGELVEYGDKPKDFLADVLTDETVEFIETTRQPFYAQLNLTNPHSPAPVAKRHLRSNRKAGVPRTTVYNAVGTDEPAWRSSLGVMSPKRLANLDERWQLRVQSAESIADAYDDVRAALRRSGKLDSTLIVVGSDNGFHMASRRLPPGKRTPYAEDTVVPYVFIGPGIAPGTTFEGMTSTIDLAPTITSLLGTTAPGWVDGRSLVPILQGQRPSDWRTGILTESMSAPTPGDPDYDTFKPPQFRALRTPQWLYVEYEDGSRELIDRTTPEGELNNLLNTAAPELVDQLKSQLGALKTCAGETCRIADSLPN